MSYFGTYTIYIIYLYCFNEVIYNYYVILDEYLFF